MTSFEIVSNTPLGKTLISAAILILFFQLFLLTVAINKKHAAKSVLQGIHVLIWSVFLALILDGIYKLDYLPYERLYFPAVAAVFSLPWLAVAAAEIVSAAICTLLFVNFLRAERSRPASNAVKEAVDILPVGVCFSEENGGVRLANLKMNEIAVKLTGGALSDPAALTAVMENGEKEGGNRVVVHKDGEAFALETNSLTIEEERYTQISAEDRTALYRAAAELEEKQARLRDLQYRLKAYKVKSEDLLIKQELLRARTAVHTQLGGVLLTGKYYFEHPDKVDRKELLSMLTRINTYLLAEVDEAEDGRDELDEALKTARGIGVLVDLRGEVPEDEPYRSILAEAIAECAANTVKHASGDLLRVVTDRRSGTRFTLTNNGEAPKRKIVPTGGLLSLIKRAKEAGAAVTIEDAPAFSITICFP